MKRKRYTEAQITPVEALIELRREEGVNDSALGFRGIPSFAGQFQQMQFQLHPGRRGNK